MYVFRMEDKEGDGPWTSDHIYSVKKKIKLPNYDDDLHPGLYEEFVSATRTKYRNKLNDDYIDYHCGVKSLNQLFHWFPEKSMKYFKKIKSYIGIYKTKKKDIIVGDFQILFKKEDARLIERICPMEFEKIKEYEK